MVSEQQADVQVAVDRVHDSTVHLLTHGWLQFPITKSETSTSHSYDIEVETDL